LKIEIRRKNDKYVLKCRSFRDDIFYGYYLERDGSFLI